MAVGQHAQALQPVVSVIIPTFNEAANVPILLGRLRQALNGFDHELIVVDDDSPDQTWAVAQAEASRDSSVRVIRRTDVHGLSSAVVTGMWAARGAVIAVIDADLQHDERILGEMVARIHAGAEVCVGSRDAVGGSYGSWSKTRRFASWVAARLARYATGVAVSDPMSGYFVIARSLFERTVEAVNPRGFKILLEFLARGTPERVDEVGYVFRERRHGKTKFGTTVVLDYLIALVDLRFGWIVSAQFVKYGFVGCVGMGVNLLGYLVARAAQLDAVGAILIGVELAIIWNFFANNFFTFRRVSYRGARMLAGLGLYQLMSLHGLLVQLAVFQLVRTAWPLAEMGFGGSVVANAVAIAVAAVGNYFLHANYTWKHLTRRPGRARSPAGSIRDGEHESHPAASSAGPQRQPRGGGPAPSYDGDESRGGVAAARQTPTLTTA